MQFVIVAELFAWKSRSYTLTLLQLGEAPGINRGKVHYVAFSRNLLESVLPFIKWANLPQNTRVVVMLDERLHVAIF